MLTIVFWDVVLLVALLMFSVPLPYCFGGALLFMSLFGDVSMKSMMLWAFDQMINPVLLASPLFILAGILMGGSGIAKKRRRIGARPDDRGGAAVLPPPHALPPGRPRGPR